MLKRSFGFSWLLIPWLRGLRTLVCMHDAHSGAVTHKLQSSLTRASPHCSAESPKIAAFLSILFSERLQTLRGIVTFGDQARSLLGQNQYIRPAGVCKGYCI